MTQQEQGRSTSQRSLPPDSLLQSYLACDQAAVAEKLLHELIGAARLIIESIVRRRLVFYSASKIQDREDLCGEVIVELPRPLLPRLVISLALAACFAALGCNRQGSPSGEAHQSAVAGPFDPCSLLTSGEVATAIQASAVESQHSDSSHCMYRAKDGFNVLIVEAGGHGADSVFSGLRAGNALIGGSEKVSKVGDESISWAMGQEFSARNGDAYVTIDMRGMTKGQTSVVGPQLAQKALARL